MDKVGKRVDRGGFRGTIRYYGKLLHVPTKGKFNPQDLWVGVEWDEASRGTHSGSVEGVEYFSTFDGAERATLTKEKLLDFGVDFVMAWVRRYLTNAEIEELSTDRDQLLQYLFELAGHAERAMKDKSIEFDENALIRTSKRFKKIEFLGFNRIWNSIKDLKRMSLLSLSDQGISGFGAKGEIRSLFPVLKELSLERNLIGSWNEVFRLSIECPNLEILVLNDNILLTDNQLTEMRQSSAKKIQHDEANDQISSEKAHENHEKITEDYVPFENLRHLSLKSTRTSWNTLSGFLHLFPILEELVMSNNCCADFDKLKLENSALKNLKRLDISENGLQNPQGLACFSVLKLEKLNASNNDFENFPLSGVLRNLTHINISNNRISTSEIMGELSKFEALNSLRFTDNPLFNILDKKHLRCIEIASCKTLKKLNGSEISREERRDSEIYYLKNAFHEFFKLTNTTMHTYDYPQFEVWALKEFPLIGYYISKFGNPYEIEERNYLDAIRPESEVKKLAPVPAPVTEKNRFINVKIQKVGQVTPPIRKKFPRSIDVGFVRNFIKMSYKIQQNFKICIFDPLGSIPLDNNFKKLEDYTDDNDIQINWSE